MWIFRKNATGSWVQDAGMPLIGTGGGTAPYQGIVVSLSSDGSTLVETGYTALANLGAFWAFRYNPYSQVWNQLAGPITGSGNIGAASQGSDLAISGDGSTVISGGIYDNGNVGATVRTLFGQISRQVMCVYVLTCPMAVPFFFNAFFHMH